jgi:signal transduction histidine kinase
MHPSPWDQVGFLLTSAAACVIWWIALLVWRRDRQSALNRAYAASLLFLGLWMLTGFADRLVGASPMAILWTYRAAYFLSCAGSACFLLFLIVFHRGSAPPRPVPEVILAVGAFFSLLSLTGLIVRSAHVDGGALKVVYGGAHGAVVLYLLTSFSAGLILLFLKWQKSVGIEHARASIMLLGTSLFVPPAFSLALVAPLLSGDYAFANYASVAAVIPVGFTAYAVLRLRLMDTRVIVRRMSIVALETVLVAAPLAVVLALLHASGVSAWTELAASFLLFMALFYAAPAVRRRVEKLSSRLFFSGMYEELDLLERVSLMLAAQPDMQKGLLEAMDLIRTSLGLWKVELVLGEEVTGGGPCRLACLLNGNGSVSAGCSGPVEAIPPRELPTKVVVVEEALRWPYPGGQREAAEKLRQSGFSACLPVTAPTGDLAWLLPGEKVNRHALSSNDLSFLEKATRRLGVYIENYVLSAQLALRLEELKKAYGELRSSDRFKSDLIQVASHEFRTPVTVIVGYAQTLQAYWSRLTDEEKRGYLVAMVQSSGRLIEMVDQFLLLARSQSGELAPALKSVRLAEMLEGVIESLPEPERRRVSVHIDRDHLIITDREKLSQIITNLLSNALRFSPVEKPVAISAWSDSMYLYIRVEDQGKGMSEEEIGRAFDPFVRLEDTRHHAKGMGLGLHIVRVLSALLGVTVEVETRPGEGTAVTLTLNLR